MFQLSLVDHIRLTFGSIVSAYEGHAAAASRLARWSWYARLGMLALIGLSAGAGVAAALRGGAWLVVAPSLAAVAFAACAAYLAIDLERRAYAHRSTAAKLWVICEKCRVLLAEIHDQLIDIAGIGARRDSLLKEVADIFGEAPPADRATFDIGRSLLGGEQAGGYSDQQLDRFLPVSLRRAG